MAIAGYSWRSTTEVTNSITQLAGLNLGGGADGAVDLLLVGTDSRTDAKGVPLTSKELRWLRAGDETATNTDTILLIRIPNNGSSATAISSDEALIAGGYDNRMTNTSDYAFIGAGAGSFRLAGMNDRIEAASVAAGDILAPRCRGGRDCGGPQWWCHCGGIVCPDLLLTKVRAGVPCVWHLPAAHLRDAGFYFPVRGPDADRRTIFPAA